jgi:hypothetical protein
MFLVEFNFPRVQPSFDEVFDGLFRDAFNPPVINLEDILFGPSAAYSTFLQNAPVYPQGCIPIYSADNLFQRLFFPQLLDDFPQDDFGFPEEFVMPDYTEGTRRDNDVRHAQAHAQNQDGGVYFDNVIREHLRSLPQQDKVKFLAMITDCDPEIFTTLAELAVRKAIARPGAINEQNLPAFLHPHIAALRAIRGNDARAIGAIATALHRDTNCIASMQQAMQRAAN